MLWKDLCTKAVLLPSLINEMITRELATSTVTQTITGFTDDISILKESTDGMAYCGDRVYTVNLPSLLSVSGSTLSLLSTSNVDSENGSPYTATVTGSLA